MDVTGFKESLTGASPPAGCSELLAASWWDAKNDWEQAHRIAQDISGPQGARIHAYLHRREGDRSNAAYWYSRAGQSPYRGGLEAEWEDLVQTYLTEGPAPN